MGSLELVDGFSSRPLVAEWQELSIEPDRWFTIKEHVPFLTPDFHKVEHNVRVTTLSY